MNRTKHVGIAIAVGIWLLLIFSQAAYASSAIGMSAQAHCAYYIDAGTGSIIIQVLIGGFVGLAAMAGVYRTRVKNFLVNLFSRHRQDNEDVESEESGDSE
jgi:membrane-bound metal-dependent hydrolase YbcI (DUF457 family)